MFGAATTTRPVPSKGALRVLYQLAYISSGTAVGVAALCTEERRRRTKVLQNIADNASRIRQSPRHVHNAAAAAAMAVEHDHAFHHYTAFAIETRDGPGREELRSKSAPQTDIAARDAELPSSVDRGYEQVVGRQRRRVATHDTAWTDTQGRDQDLHNARGGEEVAAVSKVSLDYRSNPTNTGAASRLLEDNDHTTTKLPVPGRRSLPLGIRQDLQLNSSLSDQQALPAIPPFRLHSRLLVTDKPPSADDLDYDIRLFQQRTYRTWSKSEAGNRFASQLLQSSLHSGTLAQAKSIFKWKQRNDMLLMEDVRTLARHAASLGRRQADKELPEFCLAFYRAAFRAFGQNPISRNQILRHVLYTAAASFGWINDTHSHHAAKQLLRLIDTRSDDGDIQSALARTLGDLSRKGTHQEAARLLFTMTRRFSHVLDHNVLLPLVDRLYTALLDQRSLSQCARLLQWKQTCTPSDLFGKQLAAFLLCCRGRDAAVPLTRILSSFSRQDWPCDVVKGLQKEALAVLVQACASSPAHAELYESLRLLIHKESRDEFDRERAVSRLHTVWRSTNDLVAAKAEYHASQKACTEASSVALDIALVEIYNSANQARLALQLLSQHTNNLQHQSRVVSLAAVSLARQGSWQQLDELLTLISDDLPLEFNKENAVSFNEVLRLFALQHSAPETKQIYLRLVDARIVAPDRTTNMILVRKLVNSNELDMIQSWLRHVQDQGNMVRLDAHMAERMLRQFYFDHRPPHALLMRLCRQILDSVPSYSAIVFAPLIREAIGYDMRRADARRKKVLRDRADRSLRMLIATGVKASTPSLNAPAMISARSETSPLTATPNSPGLQQTEHGNVDHADTFSHSMSNKPTMGRGPTALALERRMVLAMSQGLYSAAIDMYNRSISPTGLPPSAFALKVAVEACIQKHKTSEHEAYAIVEAAERVGFNATSAYEPILIRQIQRFDKTNCLSQLCDGVTEYYRLAAKQGREVKHHVGLTAASRLIDRCHAASAIKLLDAIHRSDWSPEQALDIAAMTVYLKGYTALLSVQGVQWVVNTVIEQKLRINRKFLSSMQKATAVFGKQDLGDDAQNIAQSLSQTRRSMAQLRLQQRVEAKNYGDKIVKCIVECHHSWTDGSGMETGIKGPRISKPRPHRSQRC